MATADAASALSRARCKAGATTAIVLGAWLLLALVNRGTTYHFAPLIVAAAAPVVLRLEVEARLSGRMLVAASGLSMAAAVVGMMLLWLLGALAGPVVVGGSAPAETGLAIALGAASGLVIGAFPGKADRRAPPPVRHHTP